MGLKELKLLFKRSIHIQPHVRGHKDKLFKPALKKGLNIRKNFFSVKVISEWNSLPAYVVEAATTNIFKNKLDAYWSEKGYGVKKA